MKAASVTEGRALALVAVESAPTLLENLLWGWLAGLSDSETYLEELMITDLRGPSGDPDDFPGEP